MIHVDDDGPGIPEAHRSDLMQPFSRLEPSRSRETGGAGLGLAIAQTLVAAHDGTLSIGEAPTGGARVTVGLPRFLPSGHRQG
jgi:signal transduction histidine kinase